MRQGCRMLGWVLFLASLLSPGMGWAAITCTGQSFPFNAPTDPQAQDYTVPSVTNGITIVHAAVRNSLRTVNAITIGGNAMTQIGTRQASTDTASEVYYRLNVASGTQSISVGWDATPLSYVLTAVTCGDVNQTTPIAVNNAATGTGGTTATVTCTGTSSGQKVLDFVSLDAPAGTLTPGAGQTNIDNDIADNILVAGISEEAGGGDVVMSQTITSGDWTTICAALSPAATARRRIAPLVSQ